MAYPNLYIFTDALVKVRDHHFYRNQQVEYGQHKRFLCINILYKARVSVLDNATALLYLANNIQYRSSKDLSLCRGKHRQDPHSVCQGELSCVSRLPQQTQSDNFHWVDTPLGHINLWKLWGCPTWILLLQDRCSGYRTSSQLSVFFFSFFSCQEGAH